MNMRGFASLVLVLALASPGAAQVTGLVSDADDGTPATGLPWLATVFEQPRNRLTCSTGSAPGEEVGLSRVDGFWLDYWLRCSPSGDWVVTVETEVPDLAAPRLRAGYFAVSRGPASRFGITLLPPSQLAPIPVPSATAGCSDVRLTWQHAAACNELVLEEQGLSAYAVMRSPAGSDAFVEVGRTVGADGYTEWLDASVPPGDWVYALRLVFGNPTDGVESLYLSANSAPVTIAPPGAREDVATRLREPGGTSIELDWQAMSPAALATEHHLYAGDIADIGDPATFAQRDRVACGLPVGPGTTTVLDANGGAGTSRYYLLSVVSGSCTEHLGTDSFGVERPASSAPCP